MNTANPNESRPAAGRPQWPFVLILLFLFVGIPVALPVLQAVFDANATEPARASQRAAPEAPAIEIGLGKLKDLFAENEPAALARFAGRRVRVTAPARQIESAPAGQAVIHLGDADPIDVSAHFENSAAVVPVHRDQTLTIEGTPGRVTFGTIPLTDCRIVSP